MMRMLLTQDNGDDEMKKLLCKCICIVILQFVLVAAGLSNTLVLGEQGEVFAETDRYQVRFEHGVLVHFHNKLTQETYTLPLRGPSNTQRGLSIQYEKGRYGRDEPLNDSWEIASKRLSALSVEIAYHSDYRTHKTVRLRIAIDPETQDLVIHQTGTSAFGGLVGVMWGCGYLNSQQVEVILPAHGGEIIDAATETNERNFEYPGKWGAQLAILQGGDGGFFVQSTDTTFRFKELKYVPSGEHFGISFRTDNPAPFRDKSEITSVEWRLNAYRGNWQVPALYYRNWMEATFQPMQPPAWVKELELVIYLNMNIDILPIVAEHVNPSTTLIYLLGWRKLNPDGSEILPDHTPKPEFGDFLEAAHNYGFRVMPFANFVSCSPTHPLYPEFEKFHLRHPIRGHKLGYRWDDPSYPYSTAYINPASSTWRKYVVGQLKNVYETYPIDGFHLDINTLFRNDPNGLVDGLTFPEGNILIHQELREAMPGLVFGGEGVHEGTFFNTNLAQRGIYNNKQPHPISSFLFSPWTIPYGFHVPNPDGEPELYQNFQEAYTVWGILPTIRIRAPWILRDPNMVRTHGFLKSVRMGQTWEQTWNIDIAMDMDIVGDVNADGVVNVLDLVLVANAFGEKLPDLNGDGIVNILDLVIVANAFSR